MGFRDIQKCNVIVDFNNQVWRAYHATDKQKLKNDDGINTGCIIGLAKILNYIIKNVKDDQMKPNLIIVEDRVPTRKRKMYIDHKNAFKFYNTDQDYTDITYKGNRGKVDIAYNPIDICRQFINCIPHTKMYLDGEEADDVIASCVARLVDTSTDPIIHIYSTDKDLWQLMYRFPNSKIKIFNGDGSVVDEDCVRKYFDGASFSHIVSHKVIRGDANDNVKSVLRFQFKKNISTFLRCDGTMEDFLKCMREDVGEDGKDYLYLLENAELMALNYNLVNLSTDLNYTEEKFPDPKGDIWRKLCHSFQVPSLFRSPLVNIF